MLPRLTVMGSHIGCHTYNTQTHKPQDVQHHHGSTTKTVKDYEEEDGEKQLQILAIKKWDLRVKSSNGQIENRKEKTSAFHFSNQKQSFTKKLFFPRLLQK